jgi:paraquat-inducible protein B
VLEIDNDKITGYGAKRGIDSPQALKQVIDLGLRAQLNSQSLVTGLLFVQLDLHPERPAVFVLPPGSDLMEIPTVPTTLEQAQSAAKEIISKLEQIHFDDLVRDATDAMSGINQLVNAPALHATIEGLPDTLVKVNDAVASVRQLVTRLDSSQGPLVDSLKGASQEADATMEQARITLQSLQTLVDPNAPLANQLAASLQEIAGAARAVRLLADYLERNPSAVVRGKETTRP